MIWGFEDRGNKTKWFPYFSTSLLCRISKWISVPVAVKGEAESGLRSPIFVIREFFFCFLTVYFHSASLKVDHAPKGKVEALVTQSCLILCDPWTVAHQAPLSMVFTRQKDWSGLLLPSPGDLLQESNPCFLGCRQILYHLSHQEGLNEFRFYSYIINSKNLWKAASMLKGQALGSVFNRDHVIG